jgi:hypothetical protein
LTPVALPPSCRAEVFALTYIFGQRGPIIIW